MSLERLAEHLDVSYQQVQKYERGGNRISVSTLYQIAGALGVPVAHFFEGLPHAPSNGPARCDPGLDLLLALPGGVDLIRSFAALPDRVRRRLAGLAQDLAEEFDPPPAACFPDPLRRTG